jgi:putative membrane protein (TIGR04086 family)
MEIINNDSTLFSIIKGMLISFAFTIIALVIFSVLLVYTDLSEETINPVIITVTGISILIGSSLGTRKLRKNGLINGGVIGAGYIIILYILSSIVSSNFSLNLTSAIMIIVGIVFGIIGRNYWSKYALTIMV